MLTTHGYKHHPGDIFVIDANTNHLLETTQPVLAYLWQINPKLLLSSDVRLKSVKNHITSTEINADSIFSQQLSDLYKIMKSGHCVHSNDKNPFLQSVFSAFYYALMTRFPDEEKDKTPNEEKQIFYKITEYINHHYTEDITEVAYSSGFQTIRTFNNTYKKIRSRNSAPYFLF